MGKLFNRAWMTVTGTPGTGAVTLNAAFSNAYFTFAEAGVVNADVVSYVLEDGDDFEIGIGTYTSAGTSLSRDTVTLSKEGGTAGTAKITASSASTVFLLPRKEDLISINELATTTEVLTGTSTAKVVTPDALAALWEKGSNVSSASTISLGEGLFFHITGTTTITDIDWGTAKDGRFAILEFDGALTFTHNSTTLVLPGGKNISTKAGDSCLIVQDSSDNVHVLRYWRKDAFPGNTQVLFGNIGTGSIAAGLTRYVGAGIPATAETTAAPAAFPVPAGRKVQIRNLSVVGINPGSAGETVTCTIYDAGNAAASSVVATITNGTNVATDSTNTVTYDNGAGERPCLRVVTSASCATQTQFFWSAEMVHPVP